MVGPLVAIPVPQNLEDIKKAFLTLQTWAVKLQKDHALVDQLDEINGVLTVGPGHETAGVTLGSKTILPAQASGINIQSYFVGTFDPENYVMLGAYFDGTNFIATASTATILLSTSFTFIVYLNSGLTVGASFTPTRVYEYEGTTGSGTADSWFLNKGRLRFPGTQVASTNANTLDDYEEGTWTPTDVSGAGLTFTATEGYYVKIGQFVHVTAQVQYPITANGAAAIIGGLPFTLQDTTLSTPAITVGYSNAAAPQMGFGIENTTAFGMYVVATAVATTNAQMSNSTLIMSMGYRASA